jgi:cellobiose phosphorylase
MPEPPFHPAANILTSPAGMRAEHGAHGGLRRMDFGVTCLTLWVGNEIEGGPANLYLRRHGDELQWTCLLGPGSPTSFQRTCDRELIGTGEWLGIRYRLLLRLAHGAPVWFWHVWLTNTHTSSQHVDLTYAQDVALAPYWALRLNEHYVSQYIDHTPLAHPTHGFMVASRQNLAAEGRHPWCLIGSLRAGTSFGTDSLQLHGLAQRDSAVLPGLAADLPGRRLQHEHSMVLIHDAPLWLDPRGSAAAGFFGACVADHPEATSSEDLDRVRSIMALPEAAPGLSEPEGPITTASARTLFSSVPPLQARDLDVEELRELFGSSWRHEERDEHGERLSFFHGPDAHVVLRAKELRTLRPHGHLLRTGRHTTPDEAALTSTAWMGGVFHSMLTQGHVSINRLLSTVHSYLGLFHSHGQRAFVHLGGQWHRLDVPSAFEMSPARCRWIYRHDAGLIEVTAQALSEPHELTLSIAVRVGPPARFLITHHLALNGDDGSAPGAAQWSRESDAIRIIPASGSELARRFPQGAFRICPAPGTELDEVGGDELLFLDRASRDEPYLCLMTAPASCAALSIRGELVPERASPEPSLDPEAPLIPALRLSAPAASPLAEGLSRLGEIVPWLTHNALVHHLSPRGLEQYSGGGWGTRDVCQGPVQMLLALERMPSLRELLLQVMSAQNPDGDWPQWFMFFERDREIRAGDSHGDIVLWPLVALAEYLKASGDASILGESVPFFAAGSAGMSERATVWGHVQRALALIEKRVIPGTALMAYGHGDWNDSLQPADPLLRERMCSSWTVTLHMQALTSLSAALQLTHQHGKEATRLASWAQRVRQDFQRLLVVDGVLAGYAIFEQSHRVRYLLHPRDEATGVHYSALGMVHAILESLLTPQQAREHLDLIQACLLGPDGLRLFDRPMPYHGGPERLFQRAESAAFFGREIGLMYTHAHLRYAQALAHVGEADRFFHALCQANPIGIRSLVPSASLRQANCYFSSSDAAFEDRYQASAEYERIAQGTVVLEGGWRVYSSGAGIALALIRQHFLGLAWEPDALCVDPVIPAALDGLSCETTLLGRAVRVHYKVGRDGCGVKGIAVNGQALAFREHPNPYRRPGALLPKASLLASLTPNQNILRIDVG